MCVWHSTKCLRYFAFISDAWRRMTTELVCIRRRHEILFHIYAFKRRSTWNSSSNKWPNVEFFVSRHILSHTLRRLSSISSSVSSIFFVRIYIFSFSLGEWHSLSAINSAVSFCFLLLAYFESTFDSAQCFCRPIARIAPRAGTWQFMFIHDSIYTKIHTVEWGKLFKEIAHTNECESVRDWVAREEEKSWQSRWKQRMREIKRRKKIEMLSSDQTIPTDVTCSE